MRAFCALKEPAMTFKPRPTERTAARQLSTGAGSMPNIMVVADTANGSDAVFLAERLMTVQLDDAHFAAQLVERLKWAGEDAEQAERKAAIGPA
jgi:hypothetical protein